MKKLSVIVPCYNVGQYIDRCVESLTSQTLDKSQYEIILVDDASTDDTENKENGTDGATENHSENEDDNKDTNKASNNK